MGRCVAGGSRPEGVDFARIDPPEFFSAPATPFLAARNVATYGDSIFFGVAAGPRGDPWGPVGTRGDPRPIVGAVFARTLRFSDCELRRGGRFYPQWGDSMLPNFYFSGLFVKKM